jgi:hypothetical protein
MDDDSKNMFLDVATVLRRKSYFRAEAAWIGWHGDCAPKLFADLKRRCLVEVNEDGQLEMHDLLVELGRAIIMDPKSEHYGSRLWVNGGEVIGCKQVRVRVLLLHRKHNMC